MLKKKRKSGKLDFIGFILFLIFVAAIILTGYYTILEIAGQGRLTRENLFYQKYQECMSLEIMTADQCSQNAWDYAQSFQDWEVGE